MTEVFFITVLFASSSLGPLGCAAIGALVGRIRSRFAAMIGAWIGLILGALVFNFGLLYKTLKSSPYNITEELAAKFMLIGGLVAVCLASLIGYVLYKKINVKGYAATPIQYGRKWLAWTVFGVTTQLLPKFLFGVPLDFFHSNFFAINALTMWVLGTVVMGGALFSLGCAYGKVINLINSHRTK